MGTSPSQSGPSCCLVLRSHQALMKLKNDLSCLPGQSSSVIHKTRPQIQLRGRRLSPLFFLNIFFIAFKVERRERERERGEGEA